MNQQKKPIKKKLFSALFLIISVIFLLFLLYGSTLPYVGYNSWNLNAYSLIAHNYNQFGFLETRLAPIISVTRDISSSTSYYLNHPPLLSVFIALVFRVLGESFLTGRLVNIVATFLSGILLFAIGRHMRGQKYGLIVFTVAASLPAMTIFGKMIGQESLLMFFALFTIYSLLIYEKKRNNGYLLLSVVSTILGVLTDWAMVYFSIIFSLYFLHRKQKRGAVFLLVAGIGTSLCYLYYVNSIHGSITFLYEGFLNRSIGELLSRNNWVILWASTFLFRLLFYCNPVFLFFVLFYFLRRTKIARKSELLFIISLLGFGTVHIALYPEGSYGHPYWMYYLLPGLIFAGAFGIEYLFSKQSKLLIGLFILLFSYSLLLQIWKTKEIEGNTFRYQLAALASPMFPTGSTIVLNRNGVIDADIFNYSFRNPTIILEPDQKIKDESLYTGIVYSCIPSCSEEDVQFAYLRSKYSQTRFEGRGVEMWVFQKRDNRKYEQKKIHIGISDNSNSFFSRVYMRILGLLSAPQL